MLPPAALVQAPAPAAAPDAARALATLQRGGLKKAERIALEERLLGDAAVRARALRLALDAALADGDLERFGQLKVRFGGLDPQRVLCVQRLLSLLGTPGPQLRLWRLPDLDVVPRLLGELGARRVRVGPVDASTLGALPGDVVCLLPVGGVEPDRNAPRADWVGRDEGDAIAARFRAAGKKGWMAVSAKELDGAGLTPLPLSIELDAEGRIQRIRPAEDGSAPPPVPEGPR